MADRSGRPWKMGREGSDFFLAGVYNFARSTQNDRNWHDDMFLGVSHVSHSKGGAPQCHKKLLWPTYARPNGLTYIESAYYTTNYRQSALFAEFTGRPPPPPCIRPWLSYKDKDHWHCPQHGSQQSYQYELNCSSALWWIYVSKFDKHNLS